MAALDALWDGSDEHDDVRRRRLLAAPPDGRSAARVVAAVHGMTAVSEDGLDDFFSDLERLAAAWLALRKSDQQAAAALLRAGARRRPATRSAASSVPPAAARGFQRRRCEVALIRTAGALTEPGYLDHYVPEVGARHRGDRPLLPARLALAGQPEPRVRHVVVPLRVPRAGAA